MRRAAPRVPRAARVFDHVAESYERGRPDYPRAAVRYLARELGLHRGRTVVELGSGTGKFTRALLPSGATVVAVEPTAGMRRVFARELPGTLVLDGTAEAIPLPDGFADAVVAAEAFHWFRTGPALREIARVLRPGGRLGLVFNEKSTSSRFSRRVSTVLTKVGGGASRLPGIRWKVSFRRSRRRQFGRLTLRTFRHYPAMDAATLVDCMLSVSRVAALRPERQKEVAHEFRRIADEEEAAQRRSVVRLPYRTEVYIARRRSRRA